MRMEPAESSETSAINVTWKPGTYPKDNKLQLEHGESLKSSDIHISFPKLSESHTVPQPEKYEHRHTIPTDTAFENDHIFQ